MDAINLAASPISNRASAIGPTTAKRETVALRDGELQLLITNDAALRSLTALWGVACVFLLFGTFFNARLLLAVDWASDAAIGRLIIVICLIDSLLLILHVLALYASISRPRWGWRYVRWTCCLMLLATILIGLFVFSLFKGWISAEGRLMLTPLLLLSFTGGRHVLFWCFAFPTAVFYGLKSVSSRPFVGALFAEIDSPALICKGRHPISGIESLTSAKPPS